MQFVSVHYEDPGHGPGHGQSCGEAFTSEQECNHPESKAFSGQGVLSKSFGEGTFELDLDGRGGGDLLGYEQSSPLWVPLCLMEGTSMPHGRHCYASWWTGHRDG